MTINEIRSITLGLVTLIGIILFIGAITEEVGNKTKGGSTGGNAEDGPQFSYRLA